MLQNVVFSVTTMDSIYIQLEVDQFSKVLKSLYAAENTSSFTNVTIKLGKMHNDSNSVFIVSGSDSHGSVRVVHEIPITILTLLQASTLSEPELPSPSIQTVLPANLKTIKVSCEAMRKGMSRNAESIVTLTANAGGGLEIADSLSAIRWTKLINPPVANGNELSGNGGALVTPGYLSEGRVEQQYSVNVDIKDLCKTMQAQFLNPSHGVACILDKRCLLMYFFLEPNSTCNMSFLLLNKTSE